MANELTRAIVYASQMHDGHYDDDGIPAIAHAIAVLNHARGNGHLDDDILAVAILHDVVEDCGVQLVDLRKAFGHRIADAIEAISRDKKNESYTAYIARCDLNFIARQVKIADLEVNIARCIAGNNRPTLLKRYWDALKVLSSTERRPYTSVHFAD